MIKNKFKNIFIFIAFLGLIVSNVFIENVFAYDFTGNNTGKTADDGALCGGGYCFFPGEYGIRISIVNSSGAQKGYAADIFIANLGRTKRSVTNYSRFSDNTIDVKEPINYNDLNLQKLKLDDLIILQHNDAGNYSSVVDDIITGTAWANDESDFEKIKTYLEVTSIASTDYLIIEPIGTIGQNSSTIYYGTAKDLVTFINNQGTNNPGTKALVYQRFGYSIYSKNTFSLDIDKIIAGVSPNLKYSEDFSTNEATNYPHNHDVWPVHAYGVAIYKISDFMKKCDINVNNNADSKMNWVESYTCKVPNLDGAEENSTCWKKIDDGCCESVNYEAAGYTKAQVRAVYPQCFVNECEDKKLKYLNNTNVSNFDNVNCAENVKNLTNLKGYTNKNTQIGLECLISNNYFVGVQGGWRLGCTFSDTLSLPKKYIETVSVGQHFVWPTSETTYKLGNNNLNYPLTRNSKVRCLIYKYNSNGTVVYPTSISDSFKTKVESFFKKKISGNLYLKYKPNGSDALARNGSISEENGKTTSSTSTEGTNVINVNINKIYTLPALAKNVKHNNIYAYYDEEAMSYTNKPVKNLARYTKYGYPILPLGNPNDDSATINYGIEFENIKFSLLNKYSGSYTCSKTATGKHTPCKCPQGTKNAGMDLSNYFPNGYTDFGEECAIAKDKYCDDSTYFCKTRTGRKINITSCVADKKRAGNSFAVAFNLCVIDKCPPDLGDPYACPDDPSISLTRCVNEGTYGGSTDEAKYKKCANKLCPKTNKDIIYRTIFLKNPFPSIKGTKRSAGANWGGSKALNRNGLGTKYITSTADQMYQGAPMYSIILTPKALKEIRLYNRENKYDDFKLNCGDNEYCISTTLHDKFGVYFGANGTCHLKSKAKQREYVDGSTKDCRLTALER